MLIQQHWKTVVAMPEKKKRYVLSDWQVLHGLDAELCQHIIDFAQQYKITHHNGGTSGSEPSETAGFDNLWDLAADAYIAFFDKKKDFVASVHRKTTKRSLVESAINPPPSFTVDQGDNEYPYVSVTLKGQPVDALVVAHEFSHAVQLVECKGEFMPPASRELCAFIGELILLQFLQRSLQSYYQTVYPHWLRHNQRYFGTQLEQFKLALESPESTYDYLWNYPVARVFSIAAFQTLTPDELWGLFAGKTGLAELVQLTMNSDIN